MLGLMKASFATIDRTFETLNKQAETVATLGPTMEDAEGQIREVRLQLQRQEREDDQRVNRVRRMLREDVKCTVANQLRVQIRGTVKAEIARQTREQVREQMREHLPMTLEALAEESQRQVEEVQHALANMDARRRNAALRTENLNDALAIVLRADGSKSAVYPADLRSLTSYDAATTKMLLQDYEIQDAGGREANLTRFMGYIGAPFQLVAIEGAGEQSPIELQCTA